MLKESFHVAVPTAFFDDESLNVKGTIDHIKDLYKQGVKSVLVSGSTGEQHSLSLKEKFAVIDGLTAEEELMSPMEILFGVASVRQKEAEELAIKIRNTNITGIMLGYPPYVLPTQEEALAYSKTLINLSRKPTIIYNNPNRTGFDLSVDNIIELSKIELVVGIKEAGDKEKVRLIKNKLNRNDFYIYAGGEMELEEKVALGFNRLSSIAGNIAPMEIKAWFNQLLEKKTLTHQGKEEIEAILQKVYTGSPLVNLKNSINEKGIDIGICRGPIGNRSFS